MINRTVKTLVDVFYRDALNPNTPGSQEVLAIAGKNAFASDQRPATIELNPLVESYKFHLTKDGDKTTLPLAAFGQALYRDYLNEITDDSPDEALYVFKALDRVKHDVTDYAALTLALLDCVCGRTV